jgi:hypothetical protein
MLVLAGTTATALELVVNGGFEEAFPPEWQEYSVGAATTVDTSTAYDGDPDQEARVQKGTGNGFARLNQVVVLPSLNVHFAVNAKIEASASSGGPWAAAGVALHYEDYFGHLLGTTVIVGKTPTCPWADSDTLNVIEAPDSNWNAYGFNLDDELLNLAGVDPLSVHQLRISLFGQTGGDC